LNIKKFLAKNKIKENKKWNLVKKRNLQREL
jgi:hypothetical protein